jgi:hypothetical protein
VPLAAIQPPPSLPVLSVADLDKQEYAKSPFNLPPGEAKYPTFLEGVWRADCRFVDAVFTPQIPLKQLQLFLQQFLALHKVIDGHATVAAKIKPEKSKSIRWLLIQFWPELLRVFVHPVLRHYVLSSS